MRCGEQHAFPTAPRQRQAAIPGAGIAVPEKPATAPNRTAVGRMVRAVRGRATYIYDVQTLGFAFFVGRNAPTLGEMSRLPQTRVLDYVDVLLTWITLPIRMIGISLGIGSGEDFKAAWNRGLLSEQQRNRVDWTVLREAVEAEIKARYVRVSAESGEFTRPATRELDDLFGHARAIIARARAWELERPAQYEMARTGVGLLTHVTWLELLTGGGDHVGHALDIAAHGFDAHNMGFVADVDNHASLFDLDAMLHNHGHAVQYSSSDFTPSPPFHGEPTLVDGDPRLHLTHGYVRSDGSFVHAYWRGAQG